MANPKGLNRGSQHFSFQPFSLSAFQLFSFQPFSISAFQLFIMRLLITGICGFVGSGLVRAIRESGLDWEIIGLDNFIRPGNEENRKTLKKLRVKVFHGDIRAASDFETLSSRARLPSIP